MASIGYQGITISMDRDMIDVTSLVRENAAWGYTDPHGHVHQWDLTDPRSPKLPTLRRVVDTEADDEYPAIWHYACRICGDRVPDAGMVMSNPYREYLPGLARWSINGVSVHEYQAMDAYELMTIDRLLGDYLRKQHREVG